MNKYTERSNIACPKTVCTHMNVKIVELQLVLLFSIIFSVNRIISCELKMYYTLFCFPGRYGFLLPPELIIPTAEETWHFHITVIREILKNCTITASSSKTTSNLLLFIFLIFFSIFNLFCLRII